MSLKGKHMYKIQYQEADLVEINNEIAKGITASGKNGDREKRGHEKRGQIYFAIAKVIE